MYSRLLLALVIAASGGLAGVGTVLAAEEGDEQVALNRSPTLHFAGDRYRIGVGIDTEFDVIGEAQFSLSESWRSALIGEAWLGHKGAGGVKLNYHWVFGGEQADGPDGPVYTDGRIGKLFLAADQNQHDDRKVTFGAGYEYRDWFLSGYGMTAISSERLLRSDLSVQEQLVTGQIDGRGFTRIDSIETLTDWFEEPYDWGVGVRAGRWFDQQLVRVRAGLDYEKGDFSSSQTTLSASLDKHFRNTPHSLSLRTGLARKNGDFVDDRNDWRATLVYSYSFGQSYQPASHTRMVEVDVPAPAPRVEERVVLTEVTLSDSATFEFDRSELRPAARATLDELLAAIQAGGLESPVRVVGHTCDIGTEAYNQGLSERRARSVVDYLVGAGLDPADIQWEGRGELDPRYPNDSEENRARNRRVEIAFVTEKPVTERVEVRPDGPITEMRQVEVPAEAPWIRRALRNPVRHKREVDTFRYAESTTTVIEGETVFDNQPPVANDDQFTVEVDSSDNVLDVLANDTDPDGDPLTIVAVTQPANGQVDNLGDAVSYTPAPGFLGTDTFTYTIDDGFGGQDSATVTVIVESPNQPPVANDFTITTVRTQPVLANVLANASDPDGDPLTIAGFTQPSNGVVVESGSQLEYRPDQLFFGSDSFTYTVSDGRGGTDTGTVTVEVAFANRPPVARPDFATGPGGVPIVIDVLANDFDPDGDPLEVIGVEVLISAGTQVTINPDNTLTVIIRETCSGFNLLRYTISDPFGATASANVTVIREGSQGTQSSQGFGGDDAEGDGPDCVIGPF